MSEPRFKIEIVNYHWHCGDGCCSDSGYNLRVTDIEPEKKGYGCLLDNDEWDYCRDKTRRLEQALDCIAEKLGRQPMKSDYAVVYLHEDSDGNTWEDY